MRRQIVQAGAVLLVGVLGLSACGSSTPSWKTVACSKYHQLANGSSNDFTEALSIAQDYMNSTSIDPKGGASDTADFGDSILTECNGHPGSTTIRSLRTQVVTSFLATHPRDAT